jgi:hypothetical protein
MIARLAGVCWLVTLLSLTAAAAAQPDVPFAGRWQWAGVKTCSEGYDFEDRALQIEGRSLFFYETKCDARRVTRLGDNAYRLDMFCRGEGERERRSAIFSLLAKSEVNDELLVRVEPKTGFVQAYKKCP